MSSLDEWFASKGWDNTDFEDRAIAFFGPEAEFKKEAQGLVGSMQPSNDHFKRWSAEFDQKNFSGLIWELVKLQCGQDPDLDKLSELFDHDQPDAKWAFSDNEPNWYSEALTEIRLSQGDQWSPNSAKDWRLLTAVDQFKSKTEVQRSQVSTERSSVIFAGDGTADGTILRLHAMRQPGPHFVTPHWWKLGAIPITKSIIDEINRCMSLVWRENETERFQILWWFDLFEGKKWPTEISGVDSAGVAAYCVARSLCNKPTEPQLDEWVAVSAKVSDDVLEYPTPAQSPAVKVGEPRTKVKEARDANLNSLFVEKEFCEESRPDWNDLVEGKPLRVEPIKTLDDAYESLLLTNTKLKKAAERSLVSRDGETPADWFKNHLPTSTVAEFVEASTKKKDN